MHLDAAHLVSRPEAPATGAWRDPLALLLASTGEGVFGVDLDGLCVFINHAGARMIGFEPAELLGANMHDLTHHSHADGAHYPVEDCPIFNAFRQGLPCRIDSEVFWRRDGTAFPVEYSSHPIVDGGEVRGAVVTFVDITERKRAADALQRAKDELEERVGERTLALATALKQVRELAARSETVREDERTRIAREVHDELGSLLVALKMDVNWMDKRLSEQEQRSAEAAHDMRDRMRCKCQNMSRLIETAVDNVGRIITDLRPSILDHQGLWAALEWQAQEFVQSAEMVLDWRMDVTEAPEPPEPLAMAVFRIFQESWFTVLGTGTVFAGLLLAAMLWFLPHSRFAARLRLATRVGGGGAMLVGAAPIDRADLLDAVGTALSDLRPAGVARFGDERVDVVTRGDFIPVGSSIRVVRVEGSRVTVRSDPNPSPEATPGVADDDR